MREEIRVEEILNKNPEHLTWVEVPVNPVVEETKNLAGAEAFAGLANIAGTLLAAPFTSHPLLLALAGPIIEKIGFPLWEAAKAVVERLRNPEARFGDLYRQGLRGTISTLREDIMWHDPVYIVFMTLMLSFSTITPGFASAIAFLAAVPFAALLETGAQELGHWLVKAITRIKGFSWERYYETRFLVTVEQEPLRLFEEIREKFHLENYNKRMYRDAYHKHRLPNFNHRLGFLRVRKTEAIEGPYPSFHNIELSYTLVHKKTTRDSEHNLFYLQKEKGIYAYEKHRPTFLKPLVTWTSSKHIVFERTTIHNNEIRLALDKVAWRDGKYFWIVELKSYHESEEFFQAMRYILRHSSALTCTYSKSQLVEMFRKRS